jgi:hypothetical protein
VAPTLTTQPTNLTVAAGDTASFSVVAAGTAPLSYQWARNGSSIVGATAATFTLTSTSAADNGAKFTVIVSNSVSSVSSTAATLTVTDAAKALTPRLLGSVGPGVESVLPGAGSEFYRRTGDLRVFGAAGTAGSTVVEAAGSWFPQGSLMQADVDGSTGVLRNLRQSARLYIKSGQLRRLGIAGTGTPASVRVSTLDLSDLCVTPQSPVGDLFDDWTQPDNSVLVYQIKPKCENQNGFTPLGERRYVAVRAGMSATALPLDIGADRPKLALRDRRGAITGFVVYDGTTLARVDANFANRVTIATNLQPPDDVVATVGIFGTDNDPYLLYTYRAFAQPAELRAYRLTGTPATRTVLSTSLFRTAVADETGVYFLSASLDGTEVQLHKLAHDGTLTLLASRIFIDSWWGDSRLLLSPTRAVVVSGSTITSIPLGAGSRQTFTAGTSQIDHAHVVGEDLYLQLRANGSGTLLDAAVKVMATDLSNPLDLPRTVLLGSLMALLRPFNWLQSCWQGRHLLTAALTFGNRTWPATVSAV